MSKMRVSRRSVLRAAILASIAPATVLVAGCERAPAAKAAALPPEVGVITMRPTTVQRITELPGRTSAVTTSDVRPQITGVILRRLFTEGSEVKEGQQLYEIDPRPYKAALDQAMAQRAQDQAQLEAAQLDLNRFQQLATREFATRQQVDNQRATVNRLIAAVAADSAAVETAQINLGYTKVFSPISGRIGHSTVTPGALVTANQAAVLATITQLDPIYVDVSQSAATLLRLNRELAAGELEGAGDGAAKVTLKLEDGSAYPLPGKLQFTEVNVNEGTGTVMLRAIFPNPQHLLLPGMYVHAALIEGVNRNGILVPQQAVSRNTHGDATVLLVGDGDKAELRIIQAGPAMGDQWVVTAGLKPGERVIVDGLQNARPGIAVRPVPAGTVAVAKES
jgi:membrane fusion protein (multidrug efflux system)